MPRTSTQNDSRRQTSRLRLLEAATIVFMQKGYAGARMADIASEAGMSHGLAFHYYTSKEAMFVAVVEMTMGYAREMAVAAASAEGSAAHKLRALCSRMLEGAQENSAHTAIMLQTASSSAAPAEARAMLARATADIAAAIAQLISQAQAAGELGTGSPAVLSRTLIAVMSGLALSVADGEQANTFPTVDIVFRLLGHGNGSAIPICP
jgi:AcrR family transcriptional regulator